MGAIKKVKKVKKLKKASGGIVENLEVPLVKGIIGETLIPNKEAEKLTKLDFESLASKLDEPVEITIHLPDHLRPSFMQSEENRLEIQASIRAKQAEKFELPEGWQIKGVYEHSEGSQVAEKEMKFWSGLKPENEYDIIRPGELISYLIYRSKTGKALEKAQKKRKR
jgi:hypothetical protein